MIHHKVIIIGGGPGGSTTAWALKQRYGIDSIILDKESWPRLKLCAGWITPDVVDQLEIDVDAYPHRLVTFDRIHATYFGKGNRARDISSNTTQHSIRRYEFDNWLLERSGAEVKQHTVKNVRKEGSRYIIDDTYSCDFLVGAGGTHCPIFRLLFKDLNPRSKEYQIGALEEEIEYDYKDDRCHLWFAENGLVGYSWYVPKGQGWVNVGIGGWSEYIRQAGLSLREHWELFTQKLARDGLVTNYEFNPKGHTYFVRERVKVAHHDNAFLVGDSAGLATRDLAEGIGPAVESGIQAADTIGKGVPYRLANMTHYSMFSGFMSGLVDAIDRRGRLFSDRIYARHWRSKEPEKPGKARETADVGK